MHTLLNKIGAKDIIALFAIASFVFLKAIEVNGFVDAGFMLILGYYFAKRVEGKDNGE